MLQLGNVRSNPPVQRLSLSQIRNKCWVYLDTYSSEKNILYNVMTLYNREDGVKVIMYSCYMMLKLFLGYTLLSNIMLGSNPSTNFSIVNSSVFGTLLGFSTSCEAMTLSVQAFH